MKLIVKTLVTLLILTLSTAAKVAEDTTTETKWETFEDGLSVKIKFGPDGKKWDDVEKSEPVFKGYQLINGNKVEHPKGITFDFGKNKPSAATQKYLTHLEGGRWYLPYQALNLKINAGSKVIKDKYAFDFSFTKNKQNKFIRVTFYTGYISDYISENKISSIVNNFLVFARRHCDEVYNLKTDLLNEAINYKENSKFLRSAGKGKGAMMKVMKNSSMILIKLTNAINIQRVKEAKLRKISEHLFKQYQDAKIAAERTNALTQDLISKSKILKTNMGEFNKQSKNKDLLYKKYQESGSLIQKKIKKLGFHLSNIVEDHGPKAKRDVVRAASFAFGGKVSACRSFLNGFEPKVDQKITIIKLGK